jgi:hypothetical protein
MASKTLKDKRRSDKVCNEDLIVSQNEEAKKNLSSAQK